MTVGVLDAVGVAVGVLVAVGVWVTVAVVVAVGGGGTSICGALPLS